MMGLWKKQRRGQAPGRGASLAGEECRGHSSVGSPATGELGSLPRHGEVAGSHQGFEPCPTSPRWRGQGPAEQAKGKGRKVHIHLFPSSVTTGGTRQAFQRAVDPGDSLF